MPEFFINGQAVQAEDGHTVMQAARANGFFIPYFCWHPQLSVPGNCRICAVEVETVGGGWLEIACNMPVTQGMRVLTDSPKGSAAAQGDAAVHHAEPSGRLRHLRQGRRVHAAGLPLRLQRLAVGVARPEAARHQAFRPFAAHRARQRALHHVHALCAFHARSVEEPGAGRAEPRRSLADPPGRGRRLRSRRLLRQRHRPVSGGRAAVEGLPAQGARVVPEADAIGLPGVRARLQYRHLASQERMEAQGAGPEAQRFHRQGDAAARTAPSTGPGCATRRATWRVFSAAPARCSRC